MKIDKLVLGAYENNCYVVRANENSSDCIIIDTGLDCQPLLAFLNDNKLNPVWLIFTHGHADHIAGGSALQEKYKNLKICIHKDDEPMLSDPVANMSKFSGVKITAGPAEKYFDSDKPVEFIGLKFDILQTAGHTAGGICLYNKDDGILFSGDTLFRDSIGRTNFRGSDSQKLFEQLVGNIKTKLLILPDKTIVLPGHGEATTIGREKKYNQFLS